MKKITLIFKKNYNLTRKHFADLVLKFFKSRGNKELRLDTAVEGQNTDNQAHQNPNIGFLKIIKLDHFHHEILWSSHFICGRK